MRKSVKALFSVGLFCLASAAIVAGESPSTGYELSVYAGTPVLFWGFTSVSMALGIVGGLYLCTYYQRLAAAGLALTVVMLIATLPYIRQYYFYGQADSLQHLGWAIDMLSTSNPLERNPYPSLHLISLALSSVLEIPLRRAFLLSMPVTYLLFAVSTPLIARSFIDDNGGHSTTIGLLFSTLSTPIIVVRLPNFQPIATVAGLFILLFVVYLLFRTTQSSGLERRFSSVLLIALIGLVFFHPQQALVAVALSLIFIATSNISGFSRYRHISTLSAVTAASIVLGYWLVTRRVLVGAAAALISGLNAARGGISSATPGAGFQDIGGNLVTLFARTLGVQIAISIIVVGITTVSVWRLAQYYSRPNVEFPTRESMQLRYIVGFVPLIALAVVNLGSGNLPQVVRYAAALVALGTPLVVAHFAILRSRYDNQSVVATLTVVLLIGAAVSVPVMFRSPYVYQPAPHVTETQLDGYEWTFKNRDNQSVASVNTDVSRQLIALRGFEEGNRAWGEGSLRPLAPDRRGIGFVPAHFNDRNLRDLSTRPYLLASTEYGYQRNVGLYDGLRFNELDYQYIETETNRIYSNGEFNLYRIS
ncbi:hypothetical protein [Halogeometricum luteum]|uniref:Dolichyl-phosphate-mannose-protein mannosyltransferase n=1 Tax=Halogeometricum luteum TaxID=2950537 RepID=A0ABU2G3I2_9EURY|nr:hypothetical protein [Halogeometricum sp. S3BR5-2]MDS0295347.1 hypothetical protein [Halogeometricum sp. S3BR5-2]